MTLGRRVTWIVAGAIAIAVALTAAASYVAVTAQLRGQVDRELRLQASTVQRIVAREPRAAAAVGGRFRLPTRSGAGLPTLGTREGGPLGTVQVIPREGQPRMLVSLSGPRPPVDAVDRSVARGERRSVLRSVKVGDERIRIITVDVGAIGAVQIGKSLAGIETVGRQLLVVLLLIGIGGVALGIVLSGFVTRRATAPVRALAMAAERITRTDDLTLRIPSTSDDELGQLARRFNAMLEALQASRGELAGSVAAQRQLVADASHELRTPITSLRTNLEVMLESDELPAEARRDLLASLVEQTTELGDLVADVIELARGDAMPVATEPVDLAELVSDEIERARRHHPAVTFTVDLEPAHLDGAPDRLARAVANLLNNAATHGGSGTRVHVRVDRQGVVVRDEGPGIAAEDLPHLFDRFYRGAGARGIAGTGLGLAIVRQVAELHGGSASAENVSGGGAQFVLALPAGAA
jgi:two-component system, OmpR family, sensor histidine kinase MprB